MKTKLINRRITSRTGCILAYLAIASLSAAQDYDGDGVPNSADNCQVVANADQFDGDSDGIGNPCDTDLNNDGIINFLDIGLFSQLIFSNDVAADFDGSGVVNFLDFNYLVDDIFTAPGPSALVNDGSVFWTGNGDGFLWEDSANWSGKMVPTPDNIVIIDNTASDINVGAAFTASFGDLYCAENLQVAMSTINFTGHTEITGSLVALNGVETLTFQSSAIIGGSLDLSLGVDLIASGANAELIAPNVVNGVNMNLSAQGGAILDVTSTSTGSFSNELQGKLWVADGVGSKLLVSGNSILDVIWTPDSSDFEIQALNGGNVELPSLVSLRDISGHGVTLTADGSGSQLNFPLLERFIGVDLGIEASMFATGGGQVSAPQLLVVSGIDLFVSDSSTFMANSMTNWSSGKITASGSGATIMLDSLLNATDLGLVSADGALLTLPTLDRLLAISINNGMYATGASSVIELPALTDLTLLSGEPGFSYSWKLIADSGGMINLPSADSIVVDSNDAGYAYALEIKAMGAGSSIGLDSLEQFFHLNVYGPGQSTIENCDGGIVSYPSDAIFLNVELSP